jgi:hypothetical protein
MIFFGKPLRTFPDHALKAPRHNRTGMMKRVATIAFYAVGVLAMLYLALYAYVTFTGREFEPGDPIHIFRKPDAPNYS